MEVIMPFLLGTTIWGAMIGSKNGNRFWLYGSVDGFSSSLWVAFGFFLPLWIWCMYTYRQIQILS